MPNHFDELSKHPHTGTTTPDKPPASGVKDLPKPASARGGDSKPSGTPSESGKKGKD